MLLRVAGTSESKLVTIVMLAGAFLSLFMNNIAAASVLLPAVSGAARKAEVNSSRLLMPLAFATILGGMATLLTTANIIVSSLLRDQGIPGYSLLDFAPVGVPLVLAGVAYMSLVGRRLLAGESLAERTMHSIGHRESDLVSIYHLSSGLFRARVPAGSALIGRPLSESALREIYGISVVAIERDGRTILSVSPDTIIQQGDTLLLEGSLEDFRRRDVEPYLEILPSRDWRERDLESSAIEVVEAMLAPRSRLIGQTLRSAHFREKYGMTVLAIWRAGQQLFTKLADVPLQFGDALLLQGPRERLPVLRDDPDLIVLMQREEEAMPVPGKGRVALVIMIVTLVLAALKPELIGEIMLGGALAMIVTGLLSMNQAYLAIGWRSVFLVAGMLPMGIALTKTNAAGLLANQLMAVLGPAGPLTVLAGLFVVTMLLTQVMNGAAVAAIIGPIAIQAAQQTGANPRALAMGVALATSMAFLTPLGHAVNVLVMGPGGYSFRDFAKVGWPLTLLLSVLVILLLPLVWPLVPR